MIAHVGGMPVEELLCWCWREPAARACDHPLIRDSRTANARDASGAAPPPGPLHYAAFRRALIGRSVSAAGGWMQTVAAGWLIYDLTAMPRRWGS